GVLAGAAACGAGLVGLLPLGRGADGGTATRRRTNSPSLHADLKAGLNAVRHTPALHDITAATCVAFLGMGGLTVAAVLLAGERGHPGGGGLLVTAFAVGALAGCLALARREPRISPRQLALTSLVGTGAALAGAALIPSYALAVTLFVAAGVCDGPLLTATLRIRADHAPAAVRTQVFTLGAGLKISAAACGAALAGVAADRELPAWTLLLGIAGLQLAGAAFLRRRPPILTSGPAQSLSPTASSEAQKPPPAESR
ncbi:MFS transporter, partial [Streptomyces sp. T-3]|nr:MFS transporter [Streptomyces sp. T-3]